MLNCEQCNYLKDADHPSTIVLPLTTQVNANTQPLRFSLAAREALNQSSDVMIDQPRAIDNQRITSEPLTSLSELVMATIERYMKIMLGFEQ